MLQELGYGAQAEVESLAGLRAFSDEPERFDIAIIEPAMPGQSPRRVRKDWPLSPELTGLELAVRLRRIKKGLAGRVLYEIHGITSGRRNKGCRVSGADP